MSETYPDSPGIEADGLKRAFGDVRAVDGVSFVAPAGAVTAFIGPNGSGKTTLLLLLAGLLLVNLTELRGGHAPAWGWRYASGLALAVLALGCWTWYPLRNARWMRAHPDQSPTTWATAQGLVTLPLACLAYGGVSAVLAVAQPGFALPLGPRPLVFAGLMLTIGLLCSWLGTLLWNAASQRLPTTLLGPMIVFETLSALAYAFVLRQEWPALPNLTGIACLIAGVTLAMRIRPEPV